MVEIRIIPPGNARGYRNPKTLKKFKKRKSKIRRVVKRPDKDEKQRWAKIRYKALKAGNGKCFLCGRGAHDDVVLHVDHIKPKSKYPELRWKLSNLQILCAACNFGKGHTDETDWRTDELRERFLDAMSIDD